MSNIKQDALARISHPQPVHGHLDPPGNEARRQMCIEVFPPLLVIHLKRSLYNPRRRRRGQHRKTHSVHPGYGNPAWYGFPLSFPPRAADSDNSSWLCGSRHHDTHCPKSTGAQHGSYTVYSVLYHHGVSASGGRIEMVVMQKVGFTSAMRL